jgi:hypothetical protein
MMLDERPARTLEEHFMADLKFAKEIHLEEFRRRPWLDHVKEAVCYAFWRIL